MKILNKRILISIVLITLILILDFVTKILLDNKNFEVLSGVFSFVSTHNYGAAFGILQNARLFFIILAVIVLSVILYIDLKYKLKNKWYNAGFILIFAGSVGNLIDRIFLGYVRDFIKLDFINFAIFNVADSALTIGTICMMIFILFYFNGVSDKKVNKESPKEIKSSDNIGGIK